MKHIVTITQKPVLSGKQSVPDGALCGNGDLGIILGNGENGLRVYLSKCDLRYAVESHDKGGLRPLGAVDFEIDAALYDTYRVEQDMDKFELRCEFKNGDRLLTIRLIPNKTENSLLIEVDGNVEAKPVLRSLGIDGENGTLCETVRYVPFYESGNARKILDQLMIGPQNYDTVSGLSPVLPKGLRDADLIGVSLEKETLALNFSSRLLTLAQDMGPEAERNMVYAIVNSLCRLQGVDRVSFFIMGQQPETFTGAIFLPGDFLPTGQ